MVGSFYDPELDEGCAFEELISFHGGIGGLQTRPFILHPQQLEVPAGPILGAASVHGILAGWRRQLQGGGGAAGPVHDGTSVPDTVEQPVGQTTWRACSRRYVSIRACLLRRLGRTHDGSAASAA